MTKEMARITRVIEKVKNFLVIFSHEVTPILDHTISSGSGAGNIFKL
jgi:hypothetical protein